MSVRIGIGVTYAREEKRVDYLKRENIDEICKRDTDAKIEEIRENEEEKKKEKNEEERMEEDRNIVNGDEDKRMIERKRKKKATNEEERKEEKKECNREGNGRI